MSGRFDFLSVEMKQMFCFNGGTWDGERAIAVHHKKQILRRNQL